MALLGKKKRKISPEKLNRIKTVFGHDVQFDEKGRPVEQGLGAPGNETMPHYAARLKMAKIDYKHSQTEEHKTELAEAQRLYDAALKEHSDLMEEDEEEEWEDNEATA